MVEMDNVSLKNAKAAISIMIFTAAGNVLGLIRESTLAAYFGASTLTDAYKVAFNIPFITLSIISAAISTTFIPVYTEFKKNKSSAQVQYFLNNLFNTTAFITVALTAVGMISAPFIVNIIAPGFKSEIYSLTVKLTVIMLPSLIFLALTNLVGGYLQSNSRFLIVAFTGIPFNLFIIGSIVFPFTKGIELVALGSLLGVFSQFLVQIPSMVRTGFRFKPVFFCFREEGIRRIFVLTIPILIGSVFNQIYLIIDRVLASGLDQGSISALDYANKVIGSIGNIFILSIITVTYPNLAYLSNNSEKFHAAFSKAMRIIIYISLPIMTGVIILRTPIIKVLFERGVFSQHDTYVTSNALGCLSLGIIGAGVGGLLSKTYYSLKDTKTPVVSGIISVCVNIPLSIIFTRNWGVEGLAIATSGSSLLYSGILFIWLRMKVRLINGRVIIIALIKALCAVSIMGMVVYTLNRLCGEYIFKNPSPGWTAAGLVFNTVSGFIIYTVIMYALKVEEMVYLKKLLANKICILLKPKPVTILKSKHKVVTSNIKGSREMDRYAVIMAGGDGTRFWPLSRQQAPKQLLNISGNDTMINESIKRLHGTIDINNILVVTGRKQIDAVNRLIINELPRKNILLEPAGRNTSACIAYAAISISLRCKEGIMCVFPSDHYISNRDSFRKTLGKACEAAEKTGKLITIGIKPTFPSTGYGYIHCSPNRYKDFNGAYEAIGFIEKPEIDRARSFVESGEYLWNSGIFVWRLTTILDNLRRYLPRLYNTMIGIRDHIGIKTEQEVLEKAYAEVQSISIDYGILERSDDILAIPGEFGWNDIGNWDALGAILPFDDNGNIIKANYVGMNTFKSIIYGSDRLITTIGLDNIIIADTADALLVCSKDKAQEVKGLVEEIKKRGLEKYL